MIILFVWDAWKNMMGIGRGGACVPARVAPQGRIHRSTPAWHDDTQMCVVDDMFKIVIECREGTTPSVLYFCQPRVADDRRLPWVKSWRGTYAIGIVLFLINFRVGKSFAACGNDVR